MRVLWPVTDRPFLRTHSHIDETGVCQSIFDFGTDVELHARFLASIDHDFVPERVGVIILDLGQVRAKQKAWFSLVEPATWLECVVNFSVHRNPIWNTSKKLTSMNEIVFVRCCPLRIKVFQNELRVRRNPSGLY